MCRNNLEKNWFTKVGYEFSAEATKQGKMTSFCTVDQFLYHPSQNVNFEYKSSFSPNAWLLKRPPMLHMFGTFVWVSPFVFLNINGQPCDIYVVPT